MTLDVAKNCAEDLVTCGALILSLEFLRRLSHVLYGLYTFTCNASENYVWLRGRSFPAKLQNYFEAKISPWFDLKFVCLWLVVLTGTLYTKERSTSITIFPSFLVLGCVYIILHDKLILSQSFVDQELTNGTNHIGPGLAVAWFSYIENTLQDKKGLDKKSLQQYKVKQCIGSGLGISEAYKTGYFITDKPIILCPDLPSYIEEYEGYLEHDSGKWCMALTPGIVKIDQMKRKENGERQWLQLMAENMSYKYEVSGDARSCEFCVVRWEDIRSSPHPRLKYFRVIDNRPLDSMRKWYHNQKPYVTMEELKNQYELFVETLRTKLSEDENLKDKCYLLPFSGILSKELIPFEEYVRRCEKLPI